MSTTTGSIPQKVENIVAGLCFLRLPINLIYSIHYLNKEKIVHIFYYSGLCETPNAREEARSLKTVVLID